MCTVDSHPLIKNSLAVRIILPIQYVRQLYIW